MDLPRSVFKRNQKRAAVKRTATRNATHKATEKDMSPTKNVAVEYDVLTD
jgi:hypothetical protein